MPAGLVLTHPETCLPPDGPFLVVSLARSGNSPESRAVVDWLLESRPHARHLFITCNREGVLATAYRDRPGVRTMVLDEKTNDRSLVMTSSFTNMVLAGRALAGDRACGRSRARRSPAPRAELLRDQADALAAVARSGFGSVVYLGSGCRLGSAREVALKMLEMNAGEVWTLAESFLGLRHGPMSAIGPDTLVVAFLSSDPLVRAVRARPPGASSTASRSGRGGSSSARSCPPGLAPRADDARGSTAGEARLRGRAT